MNWWKKGAWKGESVSVQAVGWVTGNVWFDCWQGPEISSSPKLKVAGVCVCVCVCVRERERERETEFKLNGGAPLGDRVQGEEK